MLTQEKIEQARQSAAQGMDIKEIAISIDTTPDTIARYVKDIKKARKQAFSQAVKILSCNQLFLTHEVIARILNISRTKVTRIAQSLNLPNSLDYVIPKNIETEEVKKQVEALENLRKQAISNASELVQPKNILNCCQDSTPEKIRKPARDWNGLSQDLAWKDREIEVEKSNVAHLELLLVSERQENEEISEKLQVTIQEKDDLEAANNILEARANELERQNQELAQKVRELEEKLQQSEMQKKELADKLDYTEKKLHSLAQRMQEQEKRCQEQQPTTPSWAADYPNLWSSLQLLVKAWGQCKLARELSQLGIKTSRAIVRTWLGIINVKPLFPKRSAATAILSLASSLAPCTNAFPV